MSSELTPTVNSEEINETELSRLNADQLRGLVKTLQQNQSDLEARRYVESSMSRFGNIVRYGSEDSLESWGERILEELVDAVNGLQASLYIVSNAEAESDEDKSLSLVAAYAFDREELKASIPFGNSVLGQAAKSRKMRYFQDKTFKIRSYTSFADLEPNVLLILPLIFNEQLLGMLEISSMNPFTEQEIDFMKLLGENIAANIMSIQNQERTRKLFQEMQQKAEALQAQEEEMRQNVEELETTQEEMRRNQFRLDEFRQFINSSLDSSPVIFVSTNLGGLVKYWNKAAEDDLGYSRDNVVDKMNLVEFFNETELKKAAEETSKKTGDNVKTDVDFFKRALEVSEEYKREWNLERQNGAYLPAEVTVSYWKDHKGEIKGLVAVARDVTLEKLARNEQEKFTSLVDNSSDYIFMTDLDQNMTFINKAAKEKFKIPEDWKENGGLTTSDFFSEELLKEIGSEIMPQIVEQGYWLGEMQGSSPYDKEIVVDTITRSIALRDFDTNEIVGFASSVRDITEEKRIQKQLAEQRAEFDRMVRSVPGMIFQYIFNPTDNTHGYLYASEQSESLFGVKPEEFLGEVPLEEVSLDLHPDDDAPFRTAFQHSIETLETFNSDLRIRHTNGEYVWVNFIATPRPKDGNIVWDGIALDITEKKELEDLISKSEQELASQVAAINRTAAVVEFDLEGNIIDANENFQKLSGYVLHELKGKHHRIVVPAEVAESEEYEQFWADLRRGEHKIGTYRRVGKSGEDFYVLGTYSPFLDKNGNPYKILAYKLDISAQKKAEEALKRNQEDLKASEEELRQNLEELEATQEQMRQAQGSLAIRHAELQSIIDASADAIVAIDKDYKISYFNETNRQMLAANGINLYVGMPVHEMIAPDEWTALEKLWTAALNGERTQKEISYTYENAEQNLYFYVDYSPIIDENEQVFGAVLFAKNITETRRKELEIQRKNEELSANEEEMRQNLEELEATQEQLSNARAALEARTAEIESIVDNDEDVIMAVDTEYRIILANKKTRDNFKDNHGVEISNGMSVFDLIPEEQRETYKSFYDRSLDGENFTIPVHWNDGVMEFFYEVNYYPIKDKEGNIIGAVANTKDVTELRKGDAPNGSDALAAPLLDALQEPACLLDEEFNIQHVNAEAAELHGLTADELAGKPGTQLYAQEDENVRWRHFVEQVKETGSHELTLNHLKAGGETFYALDKMKQLSANGKTIGYLTIVQPIGE